MKIRGEVTLPNGMVMVMDFNAMADFEEVTGTPLQSEMAKFNQANPSIKFLRVFYWAALKRHQPKITLEEAGDILGDYPEAFIELVEATFGEAEDEGNGQGSLALNQSA